MLYVNGRFLTQKLTGVNRVAYEVCSAFVSLGVEFEIIAPRNLSKDYDLSKFSVRLWGFGSSHFWEQFILPLFFLFKRKYLLINFSGLGPVFLKRQLITIHDMSFWRHPEWFSKSYYWLYKFLTPKIAHSALHILTVSEFSKREIVDCLKVNPNKISVFYNAIPSTFINSENETCFNPNGDYILAVSSIDPRKNFVRLLSSIKLLKTDIKLFIIGDSNKVFHIKDEFKSSDKVVFLGRVTDNELKKYYKNAKLFVYPSVYEGFGLPPLEAMAMGCPTLISDIEVFHEIFEDGTEYFNSYDIHDIALNIDRVLSLPRIELVSKGYKVLQKYNWSKTASVIQSVINKELTKL